MSGFRIVIDSNILLSGLKSKNGLSYKLLRLLPEKKFEISISIPLVLEYESVLISKIKELGLTENNVNDILNYICSISNHTKIYYLWRPILKDPFDDHLLELAVASNSEYIITYNIKDFNESKIFGVTAITPKAFLLKIGAIK